MIVIRIDSFNIMYFKMFLLYLCRLLPVMIGKDWHTRLKEIAPKTTRKDKRIH